MCSGLWNPTHGRGTPHGAHHLHHPAPPWLRAGTLLSSCTPEAVPMTPAQAGPPKCTPTLPMPHGHTPVPSHTSRGYQLRSHPPLLHTGSAHRSQSILRRQPQALLFSSCPEPGQGSRDTKHRRQRILGWVCTSGWAALIASQTGLSSLSSNQDTERGSSSAASLHQARSLPVLTHPMHSEAQDPAVTSEPYFMGYRYQGTPLVL